MAKGRIEGRAEAVVAVLEARGLDVPAALRQRLGLHRPRAARRMAAPGSDGSVGRGAVGLSLRDRRHLSVGQHEHAMRPVDDWGRQVGARLWAERPGGR
ncbi:MAG: hypothetical protein HY744_08735 [Deltaproteobacteria bacterium]|nr:hypothetical protein [Deltaproteobacteria bacterium]